MDMGNGDYQTESETIDTEEENTDYIHPIDRKTRQSTIPLGDKKKRDHRSSRIMSQPRDTNTDNPESYSDTPSTTLTTSPKRSKKLRANRDTSTSYKRTRSIQRQKQYKIYTKHKSPALKCQNTHKIATLNINGISATTQIKMLGDFLHSNEIDLICLREVTNSNITR
jgi:hypothetical protein